MAKPRDPHYLAAQGLRTRLYTHAKRCGEYSPAVVEAFHRACDDISHLMYEERKARAVARQEAAE